MQSDLDAFLMAIRENPDEDLPRLVLSDWLQEHGEDDRGEFIRLQCKLAELGRGCSIHSECHWKPEACVACSQRAALRRRERVLAEKLVEGWIDEFVTDGNITEPPGAGTPDGSNHNRT